MKKLQLNKRTVAQMDRMQMRNVKGGASIDIPCLVSCKNVGSVGTKNCCRKKHPKTHLECMIKNN